MLLPWLLHKKGNVRDKTKKSSPTEADTEISSSYTKAKKPVLIISWLCTAVQDNLGRKAGRVLSRTAFWYSRTHHWGHWDLFAGTGSVFWEEKQPIHKPVISTFLNLLTETFRAALQNSSLKTELSPLVTFHRSFKSNPQSIGLKQILSRQEVTFYAVFPQVNKMSELP